MDILNHHNGLGKTVTQLDEYFKTHLSKMEELIESIRSEEQVDEYKRLTNSVNLDASGNGVVQFTQGQGYGSKLERLTVMVPGATLGNVAVFANSVSPGTLLEIVTTTAFTIGGGIGAVAAYSDAFANNIYLSDQEIITVQFSGFTVNGEGYVNIQSKLIKEPVHVRRSHTYWNGEN